MREKLIELLKKKYDHFCDQCGINKDSHYTENLADYLIANGVTLDAPDNTVGWISVEEPPKHTDHYLVAVSVVYSDIGRLDEVRIAHYNTVAKKWLINEDLNEIVGFPTHWMPLPKPPKEES